MVSWKRKHAERLGLTPPSESVEPLFLIQIGIKEYVAM